MARLWRRKQQQYLSNAPGSASLHSTAVVPCLQRVSALDSATEALVGNEQEYDDGWLAATSGIGGSECSSITLHRPPPAGALSLAANVANTITAAAAVGIMSMDDEPEPETTVAGSSPSYGAQSMQQQGVQLFDPAKVVTLEELAERGSPQGVTDDVRTVHSISTTQQVVQ